MINIVAIVTPYFKNGKINWKNYFLILNFLFFNKINYLVIFGTTGESYKYNFFDYFHISYFTKLFNFNYIFSFNDFKIKKIIIKSLISKINKSIGLLITPQKYILPNNINIYKYYKTINKVGLLIILYNIKKRIGIKLSFLLLKKIKFLIFYIKNSSNNKDNIILKKINIKTLNGDDNNLYFCKKINFIGTISILNNLTPKLYNNIKYINSIFLKNFFLDKNPIFIRYLLNKNSILNKYNLLPNIMNFYFTQSQI